MHLVKEMYRNATEIKTVEVPEEFSTRPSFAT